MGERQERSGTNRETLWMTMVVVTVMEMPAVMASYSSEDAIHRRHDVSRSKNSCDRAAGWKDFRAQQRLWRPRIKKTIPMKQSLQNGKSVSKMNMFWAQLALTVGCQSCYHNEVVGDVNIGDLFCNRNWNVTKIMDCLMTHCGFCHVHVI